MMKPKIYKTLLIITVLLTVYSRGVAQNIAVSVNTRPVASVKATFNDKDFEAKMDNFAKDLKTDIKDLSKTLAVTLTNIASNIDVEVDDAGKEAGSHAKVELNLGNLLGKLDLNGSDDDGDNDANNNTAIKIKNYSKSYPVDANDRIRLSNQYGKITVNTWDRHEVKVDVQITAEAGNDDDAQKLMDGVQVNDSKSGDQVSFKTNIERDNDSFWSLFNFGGRNKKHKLTINYVVYMPARTDLNVEASYGSISLPDMNGKVRLSISYGSASVQSLSSGYNEIESSYASLKMGSMNGGHLDFSYGSVNIDECNNLKADMSYGSFKLGKLKGGADLDLSYVSGFKIDELSNSFKKLNIDASYSSTSIGVPGGTNFDFDVSTSYSGFSYNENKVIVTAKTPPDGSKHIGSTRNYKGHVGKGGTDAQVNIHTSYGGVNFD